ncbi:hypothetical protein AVEN_126861-1 [Araneus ventricosus]|uniref:Uncharacterized protein n=1 Tax=Araneus ventricosus TaxID=182803 RepID=A0A4Y2C2V3_ARAVE|nr:hypothetical protein AVEN_126861-1 [Araneus ventricosus]
MFQSQNSTLRSVLSSVRCCNVCSLYEYHLLDHKLRMADSHLHRGTPGPFLRIPGYRTCVDLPSSVAVFGFQDLLASGTEPVHLNFRITFATA